jgi:hypothetical protein
MNGQMIHREVFVLHKKNKRRLALIAALFILVTAVSSGLQASAAPDDEEVVIEVTGGYDGIAKLGAWSPIHIKIKTAGQAISGEIQVEANLDQARKIIIAKPVELAAGTDHQLYFDIPVVSAQRKVNIRLVKGKQVLAEQEYSFSRLLRPEIMLIGVLSEEKDAFGFLNGNTVPVAFDQGYQEKMQLMIAAGQVAQATTMRADGDGYEKRQAVVVPLDRNSFPEKTEVIDGFDFLIINKFDTSLLSDSQISTLETWVSSGGILILGTGMNWQKVYHGLPDSLKPYTIHETKDILCTETLERFSGRHTPDMTMKLALGKLGFEYIPLPVGDENYKPGEPVRWFANDVIAGDANNPLVIKYEKEIGTILVLTFDPISEPFASWQGRISFFENMFKFIGVNMQRFYERGNGFFQKQVYNNYELEHLATEVPSEKKPPFLWMFISLGVYIIIAGPVLYLILKKMDKRDWAWVCIPALSILFLAGMYLLGFKTRYHSAVVNTASLVRVSSDVNEAAVTSSIGVFNDRRGTLKMEYDPSSGLENPFNVYSNTGYRYYGDDFEGVVTGKYTISSPISYEQYDVMLWTPTVIRAEKTIPFSGDILKELFLKDGKLKGRITNTSPYHLLDSLVIIGTNLIPIGDIPAGDTVEVSIPFDSPDIYKRPDEYLDGFFGRTYYNNTRDIPSDYQEMMRRRRIFENYVNEIYNRAGKIQMFLLARNSQVIDYGLKVNNKEPQKYHQNLILIESDLSFEPGREVEIPGGIIKAGVYIDNEVGWQESNYGIRIHNTGEMEFRFAIPEKLSVTGFGVSTETYIPLYIKYNMENNQSSRFQTEILENRYEYFLYNVITHSWDMIEAKTTIQDDAYQYIGQDNEVRMKVLVVELGQPDITEDRNYDVYKEYQQELLSIPEISVQGVAK